MECHVYVNVTTWNIECEQNMNYVKRKTRKLIVYAERVSANICCHLRNFPSDSRSFHDFSFNPSRKILYALKFRRKHIIISRLPLFSLCWDITSNFRSNPKIPWRHQHADKLKFHFKLLHHSFASSRVKTETLTLEIALFDVFKK